MTSSPKLPKAPSDLNDRAAKLWVDLNRQYLFDPGPLALLGEALRALSRADQARELVERDGIVVRDRFGIPKEHPAARLELSHRAAAAAILKSLDLNLPSVEHRHD